MKIIRIPVYYTPDNKDTIEAIHGFVPLAFCDTESVVFTRIPVAMKEDKEEFEGKTIEYSRIYADGFQFSSPYSLDKLIELFKQLE